MGAASEVTGQDLVDAARRRCDQVESDFRSPGDWFKLISAAWAKVYRRIIVKGGDEFLDYFDLATADGTESYDLRYDVWKPKGFFHVVSTTEQRRMVLFNWDHIDRWVDKDAWSSSTQIAYRLRGQKVVFRPVPAGVYTVRCWFYPPPAKIAGPGETIDGIAGFEEAVIVSAARMAAQEQGDMELAASLAAQEAIEIAAVDEEQAPRDAGGIEHAVDVYDRAEDALEGLWPVG